MVSFLQYIFQQNLVYLVKNKKNKTKKPVESEAHFCEEAIKVQSGKALKENCIAGKT